MEIQRALQEPGRAPQGPGRPPPRRPLSEMLGDVRRALADMLDDARANQLSPLRLDDLTYLGRAAEQLLRSMHRHVDRDPHVAPIVADLETIQTACAAANNLIVTRQFVDYLSVGRTIDRVIAHANVFDATLRPDSVDAPPHWQDGLDLDTLALIERICDELDFRTVRRLALYRLRVLFEEFECDRLRAALARPEAQRRREAIIHKEMNRFLFQEGYFPITNVAASRGNIDTAVVERVERAGVPPIVVELKQVTDVHHGAARATWGAVRAEIESARAEVERYRGFLASRPQWAGIMPFIVVVHTCVENTSDLDSDDVILIDLSDTTPSGKKGNGRPHVERNSDIPATTPSARRRRRAER